MLKQIIFSIILIITILIFCYSISFYIRFQRKLRSPYPVKQLAKRLWMTMEVAFLQSKIFRYPLTGFFHAVVFWGFLVITIGSIEMVFEGIKGREKVFASAGIIYNIISASADIFGLLVLICILIFLSRRLFLHIRRFYGIEMRKIFKTDAHIALTLILLLMVSHLAMNVSYILLNKNSYEGSYPVSQLLATLFNNISFESTHIINQLSWWSHILLIFIFANYLPYSKHFHVFMSIPNVFLSTTEPLGKMMNMPAITNEVKQMLNPSAETANAALERFGVKDIEDGTWKNFTDSLSCTQCGRCTAACPANITGKKLSPRKIFVNYRERYNQKGRKWMQDKDYNDNKSLIKDMITEEELWACTTCNACATECPVNINHPSLILDMRRYLMMEEGSAPASIKTMISNIENNYAPWQFSSQDRLNWTEGLSVNVPVMSEKFSKNENPEYLFWVGCAGAFDERYKKVTRAFVKLLDKSGVSYAVLGTEEACNGDPARRAGNEMLFQMQALSNIEILNKYQVKKILTICPHCFNTFKNEYPDLGGNYEVLHYTSFLNEMIKLGKLQINKQALQNKKITYHDACYLGRANGIYDAPRAILKEINTDMIEMKRSGSNSLCCGAGGTQMWKEAEPGNKEVFIERIEEVIASKADIVASSCPFCMTMLSDGIKYKNIEGQLSNLDIIELL